MTDWNLAAHEIKKDFDSVSKGSSCISDEEDDSKVPETVSSVEASDRLVKLKLSLTSRQNDMLELLMKAEGMFMKH